MDMLDGMFSFVLLDTRDNSYIVARDAIGITSLYMGWGLDGNNVSFIVFLISFFLFSGSEENFLMLIKTFLMGFITAFCTI